MACTSNPVQSEYFFLISASLGSQLHLFCSGGCQGTGHEASHRTELGLHDMRKNLLYSKTVLNPTFISFYQTVSIWNKSKWGPKQGWNWCTFGKWWLKLNFCTFFLSFQTEDLYRGLLLTCYYCNCDHLAIYCAALNSIVPRFSTYTFHLQGHHNKSPASLQ